MSTCVWSKYMMLCGALCSFWRFSLRVLTVFSRRGVFLVGAMTPPPLTYVMIYHPTGCLHLPILITWLVPRLDAYQRCFASPTHARCLAPSGMQAHA